MYDSESNKKYQKSYYRKNKEKMKKERKNYNNLPENRLYVNCRRRIWNSLNSRGLKRVQPVGELLGCDKYELLAYFENSWYLGMDLTQYWVIDHVTPLHKFDLTCLKARKKAFHYTNLQPLLVSDHINKTSEELRKLFKTRNTQ